MKTLFFYTFLLYTTANAFGGDKTAATEEEVSVERAKNEAFLKSLKENPNPSSSDKNVLIIIEQMEKTGISDFLFNRYLQNNRMLAEFNANQELLTSSRELDEHKEK